MKKLFTILALAIVAKVEAQEIEVTFSGRYTNGNVTACEISAYDKASKKLFITNAFSNKLDIVNVSTLSNPTLINSFDVSPYGGGINSVVNIGNGYLALAVEAAVKQDTGCVVIVDTAGTFVKKVKVGALPDMITITPNGKKLLVANEGEPSADYLTDPEGSISIIDISGGVQNISQSNVTTLYFTNAPTTIAGSLRKPNTSFAQDLEPEYIAVNASSTRAAVTCQESNVMVFVDLTNNTIHSYKGLGFKDYSTGENMLDASDKDNTINIKNWPVKGVYMPDAISNLTINGNTYWITANEGDGRDYAGYTSETRVKDLTLDSNIESTLKNLENIGRLKTFTKDVIGDTDNDGDVDEIYTYGGRSFSVWNFTGDLVWDSKSEFETFFANNYPDYFNADESTASKKDTRSDDKGPEPEAICVGKPGDATYAFIGLERQGGIMVYNVSNPMNPSFATYIHSIDTATGIAADKAPEGIVYIPKEKSHTGKDLMIVSNEVSGTVAIYTIEDNVAVGIDGKNVKNNKLMVYPNPANEGLNIDLKDAQNYKVRIYATTGQLVIENSLSQNSNIDIKKLVAGNYIVSVISNDGKHQFTTQFVKQ